MLAIVGVFHRRTSPFVPGSVEEDETERIGADHSPRTARGGITHDVCTQHPRLQEPFGSHGRNPLQCRVSIMAELAHGQPLPDQKSGRSAWPAARALLPLPRLTKR